MINVGKTGRASEATGVGEGVEGEWVCTLKACVKIYLPKKGKTDK